MASSRGFDRLVNFSDAVVAIAITILVLPLVDEASNLGTQNINAFLESVATQFYVFLFSFAVIAYYWFLHHSFFDQLKQVDMPIMMLNMFWLLGIVFIPFPTVLIVDSKGPAGWANLIYLATMMLLALTQLFMKLHVRKHPELLGSHVTRLKGLIGSEVVAVLLAISIVIAVTFPSIGLYALLLLWLTPFVASFISKRKYGKSSAHKTSSNNR
ncbi:putative membrane protein [Aurantimicrobium minutum]|uniref:TMEM175 family protein n=1 Tax=Aurantimicrobium minutum TaxID=708131 RepID=UPI002475AD96|nr:TMEM175 family protein [Aurantimicrobium minutum]MDH6532815.1 putative membrane protein [Aurantimicrobium minutum]